MLISALREAKDEAKRFLDKVQELQLSDAYKSAKTDTIQGKEVAAVKRASSDLSAVLSKVRNHR